MEIDKEKFYSWLFEKIEVLPHYESTEGDLTEILQKYRDIFKFTKLHRHTVSIILAGQGKKNNSTKNRVGIQVQL